MKSLKVFTLFIIFLILAVSMQSIYDNNRNYHAIHKSFVSLPSAKTLKIISFGFKDFVADVLYIWAIQYYSNLTIENRFEFIEPVFNLITDLTPTHKEVYHIGSVIMSIEKKDPDMAIRLLEKGALNVPEDYFFNYSIGMSYLSELNDPLKAKPYFEKVLTMKSLPLNIRNLVKNMKAFSTYSLDNLEDAFKQWLAIFNSKDSFDDQKKTARIHLYNIKSKIDLPKIREAIVDFKTKYNKYPENLIQLKTEGFLWEVPSDFFGEKYIYNKTSGEVKSGKSFQVFNLRSK